MTKKDLKIWIKAGFAVGADLRGTDLRDADLQDANLQGADLRGTDLRDADLPDADLQGANLQDANLQDANLQCANLQGANLRGTDLRDANLQCADLDMSSGIPFSCGGTRIKLDLNLSIQAIYHVFNQQHESEEIKTALEPLRSLAAKFLVRRTDAPGLRD